MATPAPSSPRRRVRAVIATLGTVVLGTVMALGGATAASAAVAVGVSIQPIGATTQPSGATFTYQVNLACAGTNAPTCDDAVVHIPLDSVAGMSAWAYDVTGGPAGFIQSWSVDPVAQELVVVLASSIPAGSSQSILLSLTPPNLTTPHGTTWSLLPSVTSVDPDMTPSTAPTAASGTATATVPLTVSKTSDRTFYAAGETITYTLRATCPASKPLGSVYASEMTVTDALPAGLTFVSSTPVPTGIDALTGELTWHYADAASVPVACGGTAPQAAPDTITVTATVGSVGGPGDDFTSYQNVPNRVDVVASPVGPGADAAANGTRTVVMLGAGDPPVPGTNSLGKSSAAPLNRAPSGNPDRRATYPGRWLPNGIAAGAPASVLDAAPATYTISPRIQYDSFQYEIRDKVPCLANLSGSGVYTYSAGVCAAPAFHVLGVRVEYSGTEPAGTYTPRYVDLAGVEHDMEFETASGAGDGWVIPTAALGSVSEIVIPRDPSQQDRLADNIRVYGYADPSVQDGQTLQNRATIAWYLGAAGAPIATATSPAADVFIINAPQIGIAKTMTNVGSATGPRARVQLTGTLFSPGVPGDDLVVADLLPEGSSLATDPATITAELRRPGSATIPLSTTDLVVESIPDFSGTRDLLRVTLPATAIPDIAGRYELVISAFEVLKPTAPGVYQNTARIFYDDADLAPSCAAGTFSPADPDGLSATGARPENCAAAAEFRTVTSTSGQFLLEKTVQGDYDASPQAFPAVGHVKLDSGAADYTLRWTNTGAPTLEDVVLYDVFPHVGDVGVSGAQAGAGRGSQFRPLLDSPVAAPADVTVSYSASADPCRPEVYPGQGACTNDWTTDPAALGGIQNVLAVRLVSSASYPTGGGFDVGFRMSVPTVSKDQIAWNSVAAFARTDAGTALLPTESPRVGITASDERMSIGKTVDRAAAKPGDLLTYSLTVANAGTGDSVPTTLTDQLPAGLEFVSADLGGSFDPVTRAVEWTVPVLARDTAQVFTVTARVADVQRVAELVNRANLVNPPGYSPLIVVDPCPAGAGACALTSVPITPTVLGLTGGELAQRGAIIATVLLTAGALLIWLRRRPARG